ncbi:MAG: amidohydrolase [Rhodobacteraceae bacterium]|nr:amidohydrolase [Paracoccaceae bacterium]
MSNADVAELTEFRRDLHRFPEVSGDEVETAKRVVAALGGLRPDQIITGLGGQGVAAVFNGAAPGETVLFRAELDALPIDEVGQPEWRSTIPGKGHMCGHDGHMTILLALGRMLARKRPARGRVVLMFQPAEETGAGAALVVADPRFADIKPDWAFALHNMPGLAFGHCTLRPGTMMCASQGLRVQLTGKTAHAAMPETGTSPALAVARLIPALLALGPGGTLDADFRMVTITHVRMGEPAFGISPGYAEIWVKLRTRDDAPMAAMYAEAVALIEAEAAGAGLSVAFTTQDAFGATVNDAQAIDRLRAALDALQISHAENELPLRASEDFGRFGVDGTKSAMMFLGSGDTHPQLHNPDYDFPDSLIPLGAAIFHRVMTDILD